MSTSPRGTQLISKLQKQNLFLFCLFLLLHLLLLSLQRLHYNLLLFDQESSDDSASEDQRKHNIPPFNNTPYLSLTHLWQRDPPYTLFTVFFGRDSDINFFGLTAGTFTPYITSSTIRIDTHPS